MFIFDRHNNGGEQLTLTTDFYDNGDKENNIYINQKLTLHSYCNQASFDLVGSPILPDMLRELANQLDKKFSMLKKEKTNV